MAQNICFFFGTFLIILSILILFGKGVALDCYRTTTNEYKGGHQTTSKWLTCIRWDSFDHVYSDATTSEDENYCRDPGSDGFLWCYVSYKYYDTCDIQKCVNVDVNQCGSLKIEQPTILGRNVTITFTPETTSDADVKWQRAKEGKPWSPLPNDKKFTQYFQDGTFYLILTDSVKSKDEVFYRVDYKNNIVSCSMETPKLQLQVAPSAPVFEGLKDIDDCKSCIVGEDGDQFDVLCKTSGGTKPVTVTMSIGNESQSLQRYNETAGYMTFFTLRNRHHMAIMTCTVTNDALTSPFIITARVYVIKSPILQLLIPQILKEASTGNITCIVDGGRPAPNVTLNISGMDVSTAVQADSFNANTSLYTNVVSLTTFERIWNSKNVICCRYNEWYRVTKECSPPKQFHILFQPSVMALEVKVEQTLPLEIYAICTIYNSNPACGAHISAPNGVVVSERYTNNVSQPHGAWNAEHAVNLNVSKEYNGEMIECIADCQIFAVDLKDARSFVLPYAPIIEFNISGSEFTILQGEQAHVKCSAQSIPASDITWVEQSDVGNITLKQCQLQIDCVITIEANLTQQRQFICQTHYLQTSNQRTLTVNILEKDEKRYKDMDNSASDDNVFIWIILGSCLAVLFVVVIVCLIARKKLRNTKAKLEANQVRISANPDGPSRNDVELEDRAYVELNYVRDASWQSETLYSQLSP
ncbi:uncharacterized protein LOC128559824 isoform X2 [Mercenaria mercenaria]|uniref:uncharacterized protein LOC128559824 isoform X2 n=1 Tax=Mercenaria mercenaria TaxID=6596 RepID=UPI00234F5E50|nr:uncharacterized protein LOC128559824 isoform X2 [Mercenaria mercenaria]